MRKGRPERQNSKSLQKTKGRTWKEEERPSHVGVPVDIMEQNGISKGRGKSKGKGKRKGEEEGKGKGTSTGKGRRLE